MSKTKKIVRVLDANVYDYLELASLAFGGIGRDRFVEYGEGNYCPVCIHGFARLGAGVYDNSRFEYLEDGRSLQMALWDAKIGYADNDDAVTAINKKLGRPADTRVTWKQLTKKLNIVRGPHPVQEASNA